MKIKRILSYLLALVLVLGLLPGLTLPAKAAATIENLWVGSSAEVKSAGKITDTGATSGTASVELEGDTVVLTLTDFQYSGKGYITSDSTYSGVICYSGLSPLKIVFRGTN